MVMKCSAVHGTQMNDGFTNLLDWYTDCVCKTIFPPVITISVEIIVLNTEKPIFVLYLYNTPKTSHPYISHAVGS